MNNKALINSFVWPGLPFWHEGRKGRSRAVKTSVNSRHDINCVDTSDISGFDRLFSLPEHKNG